MKHLKKAACVAALVSAIVIASPNIDHRMLLLSNAAKADFLPPPPPPPPPPPDPAPSSSSSSGNSNNGGNRWKVTGESIMQGQGLSIGCAALVNIADSVIKANGKDKRELTPVGAIDNAAACGLMPAMLLKGINMAMGIKDNACSLDVARRALKENNSAQAKQELLWRDGSWERRQAKFLSQYHDCYRGKQPSVKKPASKKKKIKVYRGRKLTS